MITQPLYYQLSPLEKKIVIDEIEVPAEKWEKEEMSSLRIHSQEMITELLSKHPHDAPAIIVVGANHVHDFLLSPQLHERFNVAAINSLRSTQESLTMPN